MAPSNNSYLSNIAIFHFHDYGRKSVFVFTYLTDLNWWLQKTLTIYKQVPGRCVPWRFGNTETFQIPTFWSMVTFQVMKLTSESHHLKPKSLFHQATSRTVPSKSAETTLVHMFCVKFLSKQCQHYQKKQQRWRQHGFIRKKNMIQSHQIGCSHADN